MGLSNTCFLLPAAKPSGLWVLRVVVLVFVLVLVLVVVLVLDNIKLRCRIVVQDCAGLHQSLL